MKKETKKELISAAIILTLVAAAELVAYIYAPKLISFLIGVFAGGAIYLLAFKIIMRIKKEKHAKKTFNDLQWQPWTTDEHATDEFRDAMQATMDFPNGYSVSVLFGKIFYSNGTDTYQVDIRRNGEPIATKPWETDVISYCTKDEITNIMLYLQTLKD